MKEFLLKIKEKWQTISILVFMIVAITFSISVFIPAKYSSEIKMMIIQDHKSDKVDAFSAAKSAEYLSDIISKVIFTESFIENVFEAPFGVENNLPNNSEDKMKAWKRKIKVEKENNTGILNIAILDESRNRSELLASSIAWALNVRGFYYHGGGESVQIKTIDGPITSEKPAVPNVLLNTLLAFFIGVVGSLVVVYFFDDFKLVLFRKKEDENNENENVEQINKITSNLKKIRESLKSNKRDFVLDESYPITKKEYQFKEEEIGLDRIDKVFEQEKQEEEKLNPDLNLEKKAEAPKNLPVSENQEKDKHIVEFKEELEDLRNSENEVEFKNNGNEKDCDKNSKEFISLDELNEEAKKMGLATPNQTVQGTTPNQTVQGAKEVTRYEASSDEVKERLNKLLRGEL